MRIIDSILRFIAPQKCACCKSELADAGSPLCPACRMKWRRELHERCPVCGNTPDEDTCMPEWLVSDCVCGVAFAAFYDKDERDSATSRLIFTLKRDNRADVTRFLAAAVADAVAYRADREGILLDGMTVVNPPRSERSVLEYGFDHAAELARHTARELGLPFVPVIERAGGEEQKALGAERRAQNAATAFALAKKADVAGKSFIIVDDVITTGATMYSCAAKLLEGGADRIFFTAVARAQSR
jgi:ComF family protein